MTASSATGTAKTGRPIRAAATILAAALTLGTIGTYTVRVAADSHLAAPAPTAVVTDRNGTFLTQAGHESTRPNGTRQVEYGYWPITPPDRVIRMTLALEDRRFWSHPGIDPIAVLRAIWQHLHGGHASGASTLAMQVARMQHPRPRTLWAKAVEAGTAVALTARYGREAILAQYVRLAPYGESSHGIAHAAWWYFDKPARDLTWAQAALLSSIPQAPSRLAPRGPGLARAIARARLALAAAGLPPDTLAQARTELDDLTIVPTRRRPAPLQTVLRLEAMARDSGTTRLRATLDLPTQDWVTHVATAQLAEWRHFGAQQVAVMVVQRGSRAVLADVTSAGYASRPAGAIDYTMAQRSPGSTLKPFLYALALQRGLIAPQDILADEPEGAAGIVNADHDFLGPLLPRQALANSRNVPATNLLRRIGLPEAFDFLRRLGLHHLDGPPERFGLAMAIGALPTSLDRLMRAYTTLAEDGMDDDLVWFEGIEPDPQRVITADAARLVGRFLSDPMARLPSFPRYGSSEFPFAVALKTGTSQGYRDAWTIAWSHKYVVGVWVGRADAGPMRDLSGGRAAAALAQKVMLRLHGALRTDLVAGDFAAPAGRNRTELCPDPACTEHLTEWVDPGTPLRVRPAPVPLAIVQPEPDSHVWRNPEVPPALNRLVLRASAPPQVRQIVWLVDGKPVAVAAPETPLYWTMIPGRHHFQVRLPLQDDASRPLAIVVE
ncbi:transglycosylase domain-containing protein [Acidisphaera sp. S103]|uniref:transglycosylase domain-containing protein n=1 Tax=Acidisphaera sp. S103 TaxID=1747223 RepID=UPI001C2041E9|nr:transglycosylase domain-containing protein [Acidisphaera sp. S103]